MIGRRRFLGVASLGVASAGLASFAQDPKPKVKAKGKAKSTAPAIAEPATPLVADEQVNRILAQARTDGRRLPGMIGGIVKGEELASVGVVGVRKVGSPEPMRVDDLVHFGSCTKAMTATMIGTLVDEGKLRLGLDDPPRSSPTGPRPDSIPDYLPRHAPINSCSGTGPGLPHNVRLVDQAARGLSVVDQRLALLGRGDSGSRRRSKPGSAFRLLERRLRAGGDDGRAGGGGPLGRS